MIQFDNAIKYFGNLILNDLPADAWVAGGSVRDYFLGVPIQTDYDVFFPSLIEYDKAYKWFKEKSCEIVWESDNGCKVVYNNKKFDLVKKFFRDPMATINEFDFTVSMLAVDKNKVFHGESTFIDLAKRQLMINKLPFPVSTLSRTLRYHKKGFVMCNQELSKIIVAIKSLPPEQTQVMANDAKGYEMFRGMD